MALSQVGEYLEDTTHIDPMIPIILENLNHQVPKVRFAALHCIG